jgi:hypothetical protein
MQHVNIKLFAEEPVRIDLASAIPVFHRWIQTDACPELLIDVADYAHVPQGPGVLLIGHEANYSLDNSRGRLGVLYNRKTVEDGNNLARAYEAALAAAKRLEGEPEFQGKLKFQTAEVELTLDDRLLYPNTDDTWTAIKPRVESFFNGLYGAGSWTFTRATDARERFRINVKLSPAPRQFG